MGELSAVIFDVDGTLVDSERHGHRVAFNLAFEDLGLDDRWDEEQYGDLLAITGGKERLHHYLTGRGLPESEAEELVPELHARKGEHFTRLAAEGRIPARHGATRIVEELAGRGLRLAVATTGSSETIEPLLDRLFGLERFETIITGGDVSSKKPDAEAYTVALERLDLGPDGALAVEDSFNGVRSARAAGLPCIVVVNDYTKDEDMGDAQLVLDDFGEQDAPAHVLSNAVSAPFHGMLDADVILAVHARTHASSSPG